jgi:tRNA U55 pseudouridine synthase TruB
MAEGVLVLGIGKGTKLLQASLKGSKGYRAIGRFGEAFDTLDVRD